MTGSMTSPREGKTIKVLLWDIDGTLLDFLAAERAALRACFDVFSLGECTDGMIARYSAINERYWKRLENGEISKRQVLLGRFEEFFALEGIDAGITESFNEEYQLRLGDTVCFMDNAYELVTRLRSRVRQYAVTNGTYTAQKRKLEKSGLGELLDGVFISDQIGAEKPSMEFFDFVFRHIGEYAGDEIMIVGDSLTSDMRGGNNAGIRCCWYNPRGAENTGGLRIDFEIQSLGQVEDILD